MFRLILALLILSQAKTSLAVLVDVPAIRNVRYTGVLGELESRMPVNHIYRSSNPRNWAHETTHGLNSRIRQESAVMNAAYMVGRQQAHLLREPTQFRLSQVMRPGPGMSGMAAWNNRPLYLLDEWSAYLSGAHKSLEGSPNEGTYEILSYFLHYGTSLIQTAQRYGHEDLPGLIAAVEDLANETLDVYDRVPSSQLSPQTRSNVAAFMRTVR